MYIDYFRNNIGNKKVLLVIKNFRNEYNNLTGGDAINTFNSYGCGYFVLMMKKLFSDLKIYITKSTASTHSIIKIGDYFYDIRGNISMDITIEDYIESTEEDLLYFIDLCNINHNKKNIDLMEKNIDKIMNKICNELGQENKKLSLSEKNY